MVTKELITVIFEDHGQDFLDWDIEDGVVVDCRPFQLWFWKGTKVHSTNIQRGLFLDITTRSGERTRLRYPVKKVKTVSVKVRSTEKCFG